MVSLYSLGVTLACPLLAGTMRSMPRMLAMVRAALCMVVVSTIIMGLGWVNTYVLYWWRVRTGHVLGMLCWPGFADAISRKQARAMSVDYAQFLASAKAGLLVAAILIGATLSSLDYTSTLAHHLMPLMASPSIVAGAALVPVCWNHRRTRVSRIGISHESMADEYPV